MFILLKYAKKYRKQIILGPFFKLLEAVFELFLPIFMAHLIDNGIAKNDLAYIIDTSLQMLAMSMIGLFCVIICQYFSSIASQGFGTQLRKELMKKINTFSYTELDYFGTATLITRMTGDINQIQLALAMFIRLVIRAPFLCIGSLIMAFYIQPKMALIFLLVLPFFCLILYLIMQKTIPLYQKVQKKIDTFNQSIRENLSGVRIIRAFAGKKKEEEKIDRLSDELAKAYTRVANISALLNPLTTWIMYIAIIGLLYFSGLQVDFGNMQQGEVLALINYMTQMLLALIVVANLVVIFTRASASAGRINEVFNSSSSITEPKPDEASLSCFQSPNKLDVRHVDFRYTKDSGLALSDIHFSIPYHTTLGIIGPTGSGKSTLVQLIPRFYDVTDGAIAIDGTDVREILLDKLRQRIAIVPQTSILFSGTIRENLQWGKKDATDAECWQALKTAQCADFISSLPEQLDTPVLAEGKNFSGGQRQRLTIARALIKLPDILILDDSLSALDYQTDLQLRQALNQDLSQTTLIIISQRISSIIQAEHILVLNDGKQAGFGNHDALLKDSSIYRAIAQSQLEGEDDLD